MNTFIEQGCITLIKSVEKSVLNVSQKCLRFLKFSFDHSNQSLMNDSHKTRIKNEVNGVVLICSVLTVECCSVLLYSSAPRFQIWLAVRMLFQNDLGWFSSTFLTPVWSLHSRLYSSSSWSFSVLLWIIGTSLQACTLSKQLKSVASLPPAVWVSTGLNS